MIAPSSSCQRPLALLAVAASGLPLIGAGTLAALGSTSVLGVDEALALALVLVGGVVAVVWPLLALAPGAREQGARARVRELLVLASGVAPALALARLVAREPDEASARAFVALAALLLAQGAALAGVARCRLPRSVLVAGFAALALGAPLVGFFVEDASGSSLGLARASIPAALAASLHEGEPPWPLAISLALLGVASAGGARFLVVLALAASPVLAGDLELEGAPEPLTGHAVRPGELAPLQVRVRAGGGGFHGELEARSGGLLVGIPLDLAGGRTQTVSIPAVGDAAGTPLLQFREKDSPHPRGTPDAVQPLERFELLVGVAAETPTEVARALTSRHELLVRDDIPRGLETLAGPAGGALDVLAVPRGASPSLSEFAALGGLLVAPDEAALEALAPEGAGPRRDQGGLARRGVGAGTLVAPMTSSALAALGSLVTPALRARLQPQDLARKLDSAWPEPAVSGRKAREIALLTAVLLSALVLVVFLPMGKGPGSEGRRVPCFVLLSLALTAFIPSLVLEEARAPVYLETASVLEAPAGGSTACLTEVLRFGSPRRSKVTVGLRSGPPLAQVFADERAAVQSESELHLDADPTRGPTSGRLIFALAPGAPASFARRSPLALTGSVVLGRQSVSNGLKSSLEEAILLLGDGNAIPLGELSPGATVPVRARAEPFADLLARARARPDLRGRKRAALLAAALASRSSGLRLVGFVSRTEKRASSGVLEEDAGETLLVVSER